jgi:hypothetical protein
MARWLWLYQSSFLFFIGQYRRICFLSVWFLPLLTLQTWRWRQYIPEKCWLTFSRLYVPEDRTLHNHRYENLKSYRVPKQVSVIKPKTEFFICDNINTDYLTESYHEQCINFQLTSSNLTSTVNFSTRHENYSSTAIDNPHRQLQKKTVVLLNLCWTYYLIVFSS